MRSSSPPTTKVFSIEMHQKEHPNAGPGDNVGINMKGLVKGNTPKSGDIMIKKAETTLKTAETLVLDHPGPIKALPGSPPAPSSSRLSTTARVFPALPSLRVTTLA